MKITKINGLYKTAASLLLISSLLQGCLPGGDQGSRKKYPGILTSDGIEGPMPFQANSNSSGYGLTTNNVDMTVDGSVQQFVSVSLPDATNDAQIMILVNSFKPLALPLLSSWAHQQRKGVIIDLSNHSGEVRRTDYVLEKTNDFAVPVIVMWDQASAPRLGTLKSIVDGVPSVKFNYTSGFDPTK